jgi:hypothetical protein
VASVRPPAAAAVAVKRSEAPTMAGLADEVSWMAAVEGTTTWLTGAEALGPTPSAPLKVAVRECWPRIREGTSKTA